MPAVVAFGASRVEVAPSEPVDERRLALARPSRFLQLPLELANPRLVGDEQLLADFVKFAEQIGQSTVTIQVALEWARLPGS